MHQSRSRQGSGHATTPEIRSSGRCAWQALSRSLKSLGFQPSLFSKFFNERYNFTLNSAFQLFAQKDPADDKLHPPAQIRGLTVH
jgi:hypothetical protein